MGRDDSYRCEFMAHPGWSKGAARYDVGLMAHSHRRPALTNVSPERSPCPDLPVQQPLTATRHTRYGAAGNWRLLRHTEGDAEGLAESSHSEPADIVPGFTGESMLPPVKLAVAAHGATCTCDVEAEGLTADRWSRPMSCRRRVKRRAGRRR